MNPFSWICRQLRRIGVMASLLSGERGSRMKAPRTQRNSSWWTTTGSSLVSKAAAPSKCLIASPWSLKRQTKTTLLLPNNIHNQLFQLEFIGIPSSWSRSCFPSQSRLGHTLKRFKEGWSDENLGQGFQDIGNPPSLLLFCQLS